MGSFPKFSSPWLNFDEIYEEAVSKGLPDVNVMNLATVSLNGTPNLRIVLYKERTDSSLIFFTNYNGRKSQDIQSQPCVCANFYWPELKKQILFKGVAQKISRIKSEEYFKTRPRESQLGAWASDQSETISSYSSLEQRYADFDKIYAGKDVPCPPHWGGYEITPWEVEFLLLKIGRLHERYVFQLQDGKWVQFMRNP